MREQYPILLTRPPWYGEFAPPVESLDEENFFSVSVLAGVLDRIPVSLSPGRRQAIELHEARWGILAHWMAAIRSGLYNPFEEPYTTDEFKGLESFAELLNAEFELCRGVFKFANHCRSTKAGFSKATLPYDNVYHFWAFCALEWKQWFYNTCLYGDSSEPIGKRNLVKGFRFFRDELKKDKNPFPSESVYCHHYRLILLALLLKKKNTDFLRSHWIPYLQQWTAYIRSVNEGDGKEVISGENCLYSIEKNNWRKAFKLESPKAHSA